MHVMSVQDPKSINLLFSLRQTLEHVGKIWSLSLAIDWLAIFFNNKIFFNVELLLMLVHIYEELHFSYFGA